MLILAPFLTVRAEGSYQLAAGSRSFIGAAEKRGADTKGQEMPITNIQARLKLQEILFFADETIQLYSVN